ncbi:MAG: hypothetical protein WBQ34_10030 [Candidatus Acidiferrales bacterium]
MKRVLLLLFVFALGVGTTGIFVLSESTGDIATSRVKIDPIPVPPLDTLIQRNTLVLPSRR